MAINNNRTRKQANSLRGRCQAFYIYVITVYQKNKTKKILKKKQINKKKRPFRWAFLPKKKAHRCAFFFNPVEGGSNKSPNCSLWRKYHGVGKNFFSISPLDPDPDFKLRIFFFSKKNFPTKFRNFQSFFYFFEIFYFSRFSKYDENSC